MQRYVFDRIIRRVIQYGGIIWGLWDIFNQESDDINKALSGLLINVLFEKILQQTWVHLALSLEEMRGFHRSQLQELDKIILFQVFSHIVPIKDPFTPDGVSDELLAEAREINANPSFVTHLVDILMTKVQAIIAKNTKSSNQYILQILEENKCVNNSHLYFNYLLSDEFLLLIQLLSEHKAPQGLKISCNPQTMDKTTIEEIQRWVVINEIHHAALSCVTLQQGKRDENSDFAIFPQEILNKIYEHIFPLREETDKRKKFVNNVSVNNIACLFSKKSSRVDYGIGIFIQNETDLSSAKRLVR